MSSTAVSNRSKSVSSLVIYLMPKKTITVVNPPITDQNAAGGISGDGVACNIISDKVIG